MLSKRQAKFVENRAKGMGRKQSEIMAGLKPSEAMHQLPSVQGELARIRAEMAAEANITRMDVVNMLLDAAELAKLMSDPQAMIAAATQIGKILGHYAPEVKKIMRGMDQSEVKKAIENMTDEELIKLANGKIKVIDGQSARIEDKSTGKPEAAVSTVQSGETPEALLQEKPDVP